MVLVVLSLISGLSFLRYGSQILFQTRLREEFTRYGMPGARNFVGAVEMLGGAAVLVGLAFAPLGALAAGGLTLLSILGLIVRVRLHDSLRVMVPAALLAAVNAALVVMFVSS